MNISLCMIVKNEAENLPQCLESVSPLVTEVVIVDTGSEDNTKEIATRWGAKVYDYQWQDDFAQARNFALQFVTGDWVLVLDGDERLNKKVIPLLKQLTEKKENLVINLIREEIGSNSSPYSLVSRLFRRHPQIYFSRPYHALIDDSVIALLEKENHWRVVDLTEEVAIFHYGYQPGVIAAKNKTEKARKAMESYLANHPHDAYVCSKLGALYLSLGEVKKGIKLLKTGLKYNSPSATPQVLHELHYHLANAMVRENQFTLAEKHYQKAIEIPIAEILKLGAYLNYGSLCYQRRQYQRAIELYNTCIRIAPNYALAYYNLGLTYKAMGNIPLAMENYRQAIRLNPSYPWAYQNLAVLLFKQGYIEESASLFKTAYRLHQQENPSLADDLKEELKLIGIRLEEAETEGETDILPEKG